MTGPINSKTGTIELTTWADEVEDQRRDAEHERQREARRVRMIADLEAAMAEPPQDRPMPWTCVVAFHDGWFYQFRDANGAMVLGNDLRDANDAVALLRAINRK